MENVASGYCLSKDEWKLLLIHYYKVQYYQGDSPLIFSTTIRYLTEDLLRALQASDIKWYVSRYLPPNCQKCALNFQKVSFDTDSVEYSQLIQYLNILCHNLDSFDLIRFSQATAVSSDGRSGHSTYLTLTKEGYLLAKQYDNPWHRVRLWYIIYLKNHPIIVIVAFLLGWILNIVSRLVIELLKNGASR